MIMMEDRERRLRTSLAVTLAYAEHAREVAERWVREAERATSLAARIRTLLTERVPVGRAGRVESAETLSEALRAAGVPLAGVPDPLDHSGCAVRDKRCGKPECPIFTS